LKHPPASDIPIAQTELMIKWNFYHQSLYRPENDGSSQNRPCGWTFKQIEASGVKAWTTSDFSALAVRFGGNRPPSFRRLQR
jgi:hypothetical protein